MTIYHDHDEKPMHIDECDLQHLGKQLLQLVHVFREEVVIHDQATTDRLNRLEYIGKLIVNKQYQLLMNDPTLINMLPKEPTGGNFYRDMTR